MEKPLLKGASNFLFWFFSFYADIEDASAQLKFAIIKKD